MARNSTAYSPASTAHAILERAGFQIRNNRAVCPYCRGGHQLRKLTVAIRGELWFCHRCHKGGHVRSLGREQGVSLPPPRVRKANLPKLQFRSWLLDKMCRLGAEERTAYRKLPWVNAALAADTDSEVAWEFLSWFHARHSIWQAFWTSATDNTGRYWLYKAWRRHHAA